VSEDDLRRDELGATFERVAGLYHRARPEYPDDLFAHLLRVTNLHPGARLLEIGCATGKATLPIARRGFHVTCIEPGHELAEAARQRLADFDVDVVQSRFENWSAPGPLYDLAFAATAWHWVDPAVKYQKAAAALVPGGYLAFWAATHVIPYDGDPFFVEIQPVYDEIGEGLPAGTSLPRPGELEDERAEIEASGLFQMVEATQYDWETVYDVEGYLDLLNTFSGHIAMKDWQRDRLYGEIRRRLAQRPGGLVRRHWGSVLQIARRT
jgi:SAM-dependent methyltransferase